MTTKIHVNQTDINEYFVTAVDDEAETLTVISTQPMSRDEAIEEGYAYCAINEQAVPGHSIQQHACIRLLCDATLAAANDSVYAWRCITTIEDILNDNIPTMPNTGQPEYMGYEPGDFIRM